MEARNSASNSAGSADSVNSSGTLESSAKGSPGAKTESAQEPKDADRKEDQKHEDMKEDGAKKAEEPKKEEPKQADPPNPELETYKRLRKNLKDLVAKKIKLDQELEETEERLYVEEGAYLQEASAGNIAKGFDQYTKSSQNRRKSVLVEQDRVFSQSSTSFDAEM